MRATTTSPICRCPTTNSTMPALPRTAHHGQHRLQHPALATRIGQLPMPEAHQAHHLSHRIISGDRTRRNLLHMPPDAHNQIYPTHAAPYIQQNATQKAFCFEMVFTCFIQRGVPSEAHFLACGSTWYLWHRSTTPHHTLALADRSKFAPFMHREAYQPCRPGYNLYTVCPQGEFFFL